MLCTLSMLLIHHEVVAYFNRQIDCLIHMHFDVEMTRQFG